MVTVDLLSGRGHYYNYRFLIISSVTSCHYGQTGHSGPGRKWGQQTHTGCGIKEGRGWPLNSGGPKAACG